MNNINIDIFIDKMMTADDNDDGGDKNISSREQLEINKNDSKLNYTSQDHKTQFGKFDQKKLCLLTYMRKRMNIQLCNNATHTHTHSIHGMFAYRKKKNE